VAGERGGGEAVAGGQGTEGLPGLQGPVDVRPGGMGADGAAFIHGFFSPEKLEAISKPGC